MTGAPPLARRLLAELLGSAFLAAVVIGSGIAAQQLSPHDVGLELLENAAATAAGLYAIILMFGPVSGGHFNPVVSFVDARFGGITRRDALAYLPAQVTGCVVGAVIANVMFAKAAISISTHHRASPAHLLAEVDRDARADARDLRPRPHAPQRAAHRPRSGPTSAPPTSSPARPASPTPRSRIGRMFSDTFAGIAPASVPGVHPRPSGRGRARGRRDPRPLPDMSPLAKPRRWSIPQAR